MSSRPRFALWVRAEPCLCRSYVLSNGDHPFGSRYERELNVVRGKSDLSRLDMLGEEGNEAKDLIAALIDADPAKRTAPSEIRRHPYFWTPTKRLSFLTNASDRFDIMERDPPAPTLLRLEENAVAVIGESWHKRLDALFVQDLGKFRSYDAKKIQDLLRAMRNKVSSFRPHAVCSMLMPDPFAEPPLPRHATTPATSRGSSPGWFPFLLHLEIPQTLFACLRPHRLAAFYPIRASI